LDALANQFATMVIANDCHCQPNLRFVEDDKDSVNEEEFENHFQ
jgi:hypothetical protein